MYVAICIGAERDVIRDLYSSVYFERTRRKKKKLLSENVCMTWASKQVIYVWHYQADD